MPFKATGDAIHSIPYLKIGYAFAQCSDRACNITMQNAGQFRADRCNQSGTDLGIDGVDAAGFDFDQDLAWAGCRGVDFSALK